VSGSERRHPAGVGIPCRFQPYAFDVAPHTRRQDAGVPSAGRLRRAQLGGGASLFLLAARKSGAFPHTGAKPRVDGSGFRLWIWDLRLRRDSDDSNLAVGKAERRPRSIRPIDPVTSATVESLINSCVASLCPRLNSCVANATRSQRQRV
jgi:hypothetical protein